MLRFQNTLTTNFLKTSLTWEIDNYSYKKLPDKNSGFENLEKSGRVSTVFESVTTLTHEFLYTKCKKRIEK